MTTLITGGAGYIGSHVLQNLLDHGEQVVVLDDLSSGAEFQSGLATFYRGDVGNADFVSDILRKETVTAIIHLAGSIVVPESIERPLDYYRNNTGASRTLIECAVRNGVRSFVFSSTASVYGEQDDIGLVDEDVVPNPIHPYGRSKLMTEWMLQDAAAANPMKFAILRYFNVAGADPRSAYHPVSVDATHLIKRASQVATGRLPSLDVYGTDYPTPDGTCVRDYIHVSDLADAHRQILKYLTDGGASIVANCGYGNRISVKDVISATERCTGTRLPVKFSARRDGDPACLVADPSLLKKTIFWTPKFDDIDAIVASSIAFERSYSKKTQP